MNIRAHWQFYKDCFPFIYSFALVCLAFVDALTGLFILFTNMVVTYLPLWLTEPIMHLIQPSMKKRVRIKDQKISMSYKPSGWSPTSGKLKAELLAFARKEQKGREVARVN